MLSIRSIRPSRSVTATSSAGTQLVAGFDQAASRNSGDSLRLPGADTNGAITLQLRSHRATTLQPLTFLWPLKPKLLPPFFAALVVPSPWDLSR
jgi:hypothetical protein